MLATSLGAAQNNAILENIKGKLIRYTDLNTPEKTYIHTDKDIYINGETIWYKAYLVNGVTHAISDQSKVVYLELLNTTDSVLVKQKLFVHNFSASGQIDIPENIQPGNYTIRAYTRYMLNDKNPVLFSKQITIWVPQNNLLENENTPVLNTTITTNKEEEEKELLIDFFPEGGNLVYGLQNTLGIKITDTKGNGISIAGKIVDQNNNFIQQFETYDYGLGKTSYLPEVGKTYYASLVINQVEKKYTLPKPEQKGYVLNVLELKEQIIVKVSSTIEGGLENSLLIGHLRGRIFLQHVNESGESSYSIKFPIKDINDGVAHFTLFTATGEPVCERLIYIDNPYKANELKVATSSKLYKKREKVNISLMLETSEEEETNGSFSAAISTSVGNKNNRIQNIESWLLLNSDLGDTADHVGFFFEDDSLKRKYLLDAFLLTHGWRRFVWRTMLEEKVSKPMLFEAEKGIMIKGRTADFRNKYQPKPSFISLSVLNSKLYSEKKATDRSGNFSFGPFVFLDSIKAFLQTEPMSVSNNKAKNELAIYVHDFHPTPPQKSVKKTNQQTLNFEYSKAYISAAYQQKLIDYKSNPNAINLEEVIVVEKKKTAQEILDERIRKVTLHGAPNNRIFPDSIPGISSLTVFDLLRNLAGVQIFGSPGFETVRVRNGGGSPLFLLDGIPVDTDFVTILNPIDIEFIDVLKDVNGAVYSNSANGVIAIYTKGILGIPNNSQKDLPNIRHITLEGFYKSRQFYSPRYDTPKASEKEEDFRTTLHWQPDIILKGKETASINFFTGDVSGTYYITIEGITEDGNPISTIYPFEVGD